jgi:hypothetical protein
MLTYFLRLRDEQGGEYGMYSDSPMNIANLTQLRLEISNKKPLEYIRDYLGEDFPKLTKPSLPSKLLMGKAEQMPQDALDCFIEDRIDLVLDKLREYLKDIPFEVNDSD